MIKLGDPNEVSRESFQRLSEADRGIVDQLFLYRSSIAVTTQVVTRKDDTGDHFRR